MRYTLPFNDVATGAVGDTFKTFASIIVADTAGHRCRIRSLQIGPSTDIPSDTNVAVQIKRVADVSAGTAGSSGDTISAANMPKVDPGSRAAVVSAARNYSAEPTVYEDEALFHMDMNVRGGFIKEWDADAAPRATQDQLLGLLVAPRDGAIKNLSGTIEIEEY